jgi:hypothetical protein
MDTSSPGGRQDAVFSTSNSTSPGATGTAPATSNAASVTAAAVAAAEALIPPPARAKRGFAVLSPEKKREIASMGGKAAHQHGRAHRFTSEEARAAGKKRHQLRILAAQQAQQAQQAQPPQGAVPGQAPATGAAPAGGTAGASGGRNPG